MSAPIAHTVTVTVSDGLREATRTTTVDTRADVAETARGLALACQRELTALRSPLDYYGDDQDAEELRLAALAAAITTHLRRGSRWADLADNAAELGIPLAERRRHDTRSEVARASGLAAAPRVLAREIDLGGRIDHRHLRRKLDAVIARRVAPGVTPEDAAYRVRLAHITRQKETL